MKRREKEKEKQRKKHQGRGGEVCICSGEERGERKDMNVSSQRSLWEHFFVEAKLGKLEGSMWQKTGSRDGRRIST